MNRVIMRLMALLMLVLVTACATPGANETGSESGAAATATESASARSAKSGSSGSASAAAATGTANERNRINAQTISKPEPAVALPSVSVGADQLLAEGINLYEQGDFKGAIRKLHSARDSADPGSAVQQTSLKYLAFSYCVNGQKSLCKAHFVSLLKVTPSFQLTRAEAGHPLWGPTFKDARASFKAPAATTVGHTK